MNFLATAIAYLGAPAKGGVAAMPRPTRTEMGVGAGVLIAGGIVLAALLLKGR